MNGFALESRHVCAVLMLASSLLLAWRPRESRARLFWSVLLVAGLAHAVLLAGRPRNLVNLNLVHHYVGAKYPLRYGDFYRAVNAGLDRPQVALRDLDRPAEVAREDPREQRAYFIELMRRHGESVDTTVTLAELRSHARASGAMQREAERILGETLASADHARFREDLRRAVEVERAEEHATGGYREIASDYGFNGSPLYASLRQLDPTLHIAFGRGTAWVNLAWQLSALFAIAGLIGAALALDGSARLAIAALVLASWDYVGWALGGLVCAGLWLPLALALFAWSRGRFALSGACIAWAGLIKLFPFVLLMPCVVRCVRALVLRTGFTGAARSSARALAGACVATLVLIVASSVSGRSWLEFGHKIAVQFGSARDLANNVGVDAALSSLGIHESLVHLALASLALLTFVVLFARGDDGEFAGALPRRAWLMLAAIGWIAHTWLNYYSLAPLMLLPWLAVSRRWLAAAIAAGFAISFALPEFGVVQEPLRLAKLAPYVLAPFALVAVELRLAKLGRAPRRVLATLLALVVLAVGAETLRWREIRRLAARADAALQDGDALAALEDYARLRRLAPGNAQAHTQHAVAAARLELDDQAAASFARSLELAPDAATTHKQLGVWRLDRGDLEGAEAALARAYELEPCSDEIAFHLARVHLARGRIAAARALLSRALELAPRSTQVRRALTEIDEAAPRRR